MATAANTSGVTLVQHNPGGVDQFAYSIAIQKIGSGKLYSVASFVPEFNIYESLLSKSLSLTMSFIDGADLVSAISLQPGDGIQISLYKDPDGQKINLSNFVIQDINGGQRVKSGQGQLYIINAVQSHAIKNLVSCVNKAYTGTLSDTLQQLCSDQFGISNINVENTNGSRTVVFPSCQAFRAIDWISKMSLSASGYQDSLYYFWAGANGSFNFKTYRNIASNANTHPYAIGMDQNPVPDSSDSIFRIEGVQRHNIGNHTERFSHGMMENELMQFNIKDQTFKSNKFQYINSYSDIHVMSNNPVGDLSQNMTAFQSGAANSQFMGLSAHTSVRSDETAFGQFNGTQTKHNYTLAQSRLINQISYTVTMRGDPSILAGDILDIKAPSLSAAQQRGFDPILNGQFLVVNVRHKVTDGVTYQTICDIFRDGPDQDVFSNPNGA